MGKRTLTRRHLEDLYLLPLRGADPDPDDDDDDDEDPDDNSGKPKFREAKSSKSKRRSRKDDDDDEDDDDEDELDKIEDPKDRRIVELSRESARRRREKNAEKRRADAAERERDELKNKDKDETETLAMKLKKSEEENEKHLSRIQNMAVRNAINEYDKVKFQNVRLVMKELDFDDLEIDLDTGEVDGLEGQLRSIAKEMPYLVKGKSGSSDDSGKRQPTGRNPGNGSQAPKETDQQELLKKYPFLANR